MTTKNQIIYESAINPSLKPKKKANIPRALREQVWIANVGETFKHKCLVEWCHNQMNVFDFHVGHNIPESQGGATDITNLKPICARCNLSMGNQYSIEEWGKMGTTSKIGKTTKTIKNTASATIKRPWYFFCFKWFTRI
jgi:5-methylcytosine-specific restriction endonuclease McrA